jgi:guanylate kinase
MIYVISAPSGAGKGTIIKALCAQDDKLRVAVSSTTRSRRLNEVDGQDYHFITEEVFAKGRISNQFIESALVHKNWYGTHLSELTRHDGRDVILEIDCQGAKEIRRRLPHVSIFILPPSFEALQEQLRKRGREKDEAEIALRMRNACAEIEQATQFSYWVENRDLEKAITMVQEIIRATRQNQMPDPYIHYRDESLLTRVRSTFQVLA